MNETFQKTKLLVINVFVGAIIVYGLIQLRKYSGREVSELVVDVDMPAIFNGKVVFYDENKTPLVHHDVIMDEDVPQGYLIEFSVPLQTGTDRVATFTVRTPTDIKANEPYTYSLNIGGITHPCVVTVPPDIDNGYMHYHANASNPSFRTEIPDGLTTGDQFVLYLPNYLDA